MKSYFSSVELANLELAQLPATRQAIEIKAKKEGWPFKLFPSRGRNGEVRKYATDSLPKNIQSAIKAKLAKQIVASSENLKLPKFKSNSLITEKNVQLKESSIYAEIQNLNNRQSEIAYARMILCQEVNKMHQVAGLGIKQSVQSIIDQIETGTLPENLKRLIQLANARNNDSRMLSFQTLYNWLRAFKNAKTPNERLAVLSPKKTKPKMSLMSYAWLPEFMNFYSTPNSPNLTQAYRNFVKDWINKGKDLHTLPSIDSVRRALKKMPVIARERGRKTGAAYKSLMPYVQRDWLALNPNDVWIGDGHSFKAKIAHPVHGRPFKPEVTVIIDCCRTIVGFSVSLSESTIAVADALRIGIKNFGLPLIYYSDNGGGQTGKMIDHEVTGFCARLGIHHETGMPANPQGRGIIEGVWDGTLIALAREYETYTGRGADGSTKNLIYRKLESAFNAEAKGKELTTEQKRFKAKLPSWSQFIKDVARCIDEYNNRPHRALPKNSDGIHCTPNEYRALRLHDRSAEIVRLSDSELDTLFMPEIIRTTKRGLVSVMDNNYFHVDLANYYGEQVRVAYDLNDYQYVIVRTMEGKFICKAAFEGNKRDAMPKPLIEQLKAKRVKGRIKRKEEQIKIAKEELNPAIEHQPNFGLLVGNGAAVAAESKKIERKPLFMFESDREAWERGQRK